MKSTFPGILPTTDKQALGQADLEAELAVLGRQDLTATMPRTRRLPLLHEDATSGEREAALSDALSQAVGLARDARKPLVAEDLDFSVKKKALGQASAKGARMLSGLLYAKYRQQLAAKCHRAGVELILINPAYTSTPARMSVSRGEGAMKSCGYLQGKTEDLDKVPWARFIQRTRVWCASSGSQPVARLRNQASAPLVEALRQGAPFALRRSEYSDLHILKVTVRGASSTSSG